MKPLEKERLNAIRSVFSEAAKLRETVQNRSRHTDVVERRLRLVLDQHGLTSITVDIVDPIAPVGDGVSLDISGGQDGVYQRAPVQEPQVASTDRSWWPTHGKERRPLIPNAGWLNHGLQGQVSKVLGVSVCGLDRETLERIVDMIARQQAEKKDFVPLFLYDGMEFEMFRANGFVVEYLPPPTERSRWQGSRSWRDYCAERREFLERKWAIAHVVSFGPVEFGKVA